MKKLTIIITIFGIVLAIPSFVNSEDKTDRLSDNQSVFSPGYINAAKYQAESIKYQTSMAGDENKQSPLDAAINYVKDKLGYRAKQQAANANLNPVLQQKTSGNNPETSAADSSIRLISSAPSGVRIGTGTDKRDVDGNLVSETGKVMMSEIINGVRYNYAGFSADAGDTIQAAINRASAGEVVIVRSNPLANPTGVYRGFTINKGIRVYGGYDSNGNLSGTTKVLSGLIRSVLIPGVIVNNVNDSSHPVEISGFDSTLRTDMGRTLISILVSLAISKIMGGITVNNSQGVIISNCKLTGPQGLLVTNSTVSVLNSTISGTITGIKATNSQVTSINNKISGTGLWLANIIFGIPMPIYAGGGYGITGDNSAFTLLNNSISNYSRVSALYMTNNAQASYASSTMRQASQHTDIYSMSKAAYKSPYDSYSNPVISQTALPKPLESNKTGAMLKDMIKSKEGIRANQAGQIDPALLAKMLEGTLSQAMYLPGAQISPEDMELAMKLASILANPTEDQQVVIDSVTSLLNDMENLQKETGTNPELAKASSDLLQMVASVLIAQAIPDLLKEGDMQGIKGIFSQLDSGKSKVILEYKEATKPYYEEVKKLIEKNASVIGIDLNLKNLLQKELKEIPRSEIDKILERLKAKANKSFEEEYIIQQEEKAKAKYINPNKKKLEENMKTMLEDFTKKLSNTLESTKK